MATMTGRDVILTLMNDVAELRSGAKESVERIARLERDLGGTKRTVAAIEKNVEALAKSVDMLGKNVEVLGKNVEVLGKNVGTLSHNVDGLIEHVGALGTVTAAQVRRFDRMARTLIQVSNVLGDHEDRISALEATVH